MRTFILVFSLNKSRFTLTNAETTRLKEKKIKENSRFHASAADIFELRLVCGAHTHSQTTQHWAQCDNWQPRRVNFKYGLIIRECALLSNRSACSVWVSVSALRALIECMASHKNVNDLPLTAPLNRCVSRCWCAGEEWRCIYCDTATAIDTRVQRQANYILQNRV